VCKAALCNPIENIRQPLHLMTLSQVKVSEVHTFPNLHLVDGYHGKGKRFSLGSKRDIALVNNHLAAQQLETT